MAAVRTLLYGICCAIWRTLINRALQLPVLISIYFFPQCVFALPNRFIIQNRFLRSKTKFVIFGEIYHQQCQCQGLQT